MYPIFRFLCRVIFTLIGKPSVTGQLNIPRKGPFVLVANHQSIIDPLLLMALFPHRITFLAASYLFKIPLVGLLVRAGGALPVSSGQRGIKSMRESLSRLSAGGIIGLFPEGGVSFDGQLKPFRSGWAYFALKTGSPALPVAISGSGDVLPPGTYLPRRAGRIRVNIGELVPVEEKAKMRQEDLEELNRKMEAAIERLMAAK